MKRTHSLDIPLSTTISGGNILLRADSHHALCVESRSIKAETLADLEGLDNLQLSRDVPKLSPGPGQVLVRIMAAGINARDMMVIARDPICPIETQPYLSPCADGAGVVEELGPDSR